MQSKDNKMSYFLYKYIFVYEQFSPGAQRQLKGA